jgi:two-component system response regulator HydG
MVFESPAVALRALVVDDDESIRYTLRNIVASCGFEVDEAGDGAAALERIETVGYELVLADVRMPKMDGLELLERLRGRAAMPKVIVVTANGTERQAVHAVKAGAYDFFRKPFEVDDVISVVRRAAESVMPAAELSLARSLVFASRAMSELALLVQRVAPRDVTVLVTGESGTGKERVCKAIVAGSPRREARYVRFNCAALAPELAEAELFGHAKGAFTGAVKPRAGLFREADRGTLLLDEIGELPLGVQAKLLRVLEEGEVRPVGEDAPVKVDVRVLASTHRDLPKMVAEGKFREDFYYRLKVVQLSIAPLRDRPDDIPILANHFLSEFSRRFGVGPFEISPAMLERLLAYPWPGNVRELENAIESSVALSTTEGLHLPSMPFPVAALARVPDLKARLDAFERGILVNTLRATHGNRTHAARALGVNRATLQTKLRKYALTKTDDDDSQ